MIFNVETKDRVLGYNSSKKKRKDVYKATVKKSHIPTLPPLPHQEYISDLKITGVVPITTHTKWKEGSRSASGSCQVRYVIGGKPERKKKDGKVKEERWKRNPWCDDRNAEYKGDGKCLTPLMVECLDGKEASRFRR